MTYLPAAASSRASSSLNTLFPAPSTLSMTTRVTPAAASLWMVSVSSGRSARRTGGIGKDRLTENSLPGAAMLIQSSGPPTLVQ